MNRATSIALLGSLFLAPSTLASDVVAHWTHLEVVSHLNPDGTLHVTETHDISVRGDVATLDRQVGFGTGQSVAFREISRIADDGSLQPLAPGNAAEAGYYQAFDETGVLHWNVRDPGVETTLDELVSRKPPESRLPEDWAEGFFPEE